MYKSNLTFSEIFQQQQEEQQKRDDEMEEMYVFC